MADLYRRYDKSWNRSGYAATPQYPGQEPAHGGRDFPERCECGAGIEGLGLPWWLGLRLRGPAECHTGDDYVAWCFNQHRIDLAPIAD